MTLASCISFLTISCLVLQADSQTVIVEGKCPVLSGQATLDADRYLGTWYEYQRFPTSYQTGLSCASAKYTLGENSTVTVVNWGYFDNGTLDIIKGSARIVDASKPAELNVVFGGFDFSFGKPNYFVLNTDYENYSLVASCTTLSADTHMESAWVLTRERGQQPSNLADLEGQLSEAGFDVSNFVVTNQADCPNQLLLS